MKNLNLIFALLPLLAFTSCKKDNAAKPETKPPVIAALHDSVSYTVDGKTYTSAANINSDLSTGSAQINRKLVVYSDGAYSLVGSGNPDSLSFYQENTISSKTAGITLYFVEKIIKAKNGAPFPTIDALLPSFAVAKHPYAEDFEWQNTQNGIAFAISANDKWYTSYDAYNHENPIVINPGFQNNSTFEITSFNTATSGGYNLQAKFSAVVIDNTTGELKKVDNGYLQIHFFPMVAVDNN